MTYKCFKRFLDLTAAAVALFLLGPALVVVAVAVRLTMGRPILFRQVRIGRNERHFRILKFRTMRDLRNAAGEPLPDSHRITPLGRLIRALSVDELPQLWNVLKGDMSLVGPRPLLPEYLPRYTPRQRRRHEVMPGLSGWAQVNGRNTLSWERKFELDVWYVENCSPWLDLKILALTVAGVLRRAGITQDGHATMSEFLGTD
jgi:lipopolysaccharide/colanic/teichoic acid biosynthesis glycosyltransferase